MSNENLQNKTENEILSVEDIKIRQMIGALKRIDAPKDFDFRLKARIANARPESFQPRFLLALRYLLPLSFVVLIFTVAVINVVYFAGNNQVAENIPPNPAESKPLTPNDSSILPNDSRNAPPQKTAETPVQNLPDIKSADPMRTVIQPAKRNIIPVEETRFVAVNLPKKPLTNLPKGIIVDNGDGGSRTTDSSQPPKVITPNGIPSNELVENARNNENKNDIITKQILLPRGIEIVSENGNRRVKTVKKDSVAARSGVEVGDVVEMIDGEKVSGDSVRGKKLEGKQITVSRGTEKVEIIFDNR